LRGLEDAPGLLQRDAGLLGQAMAGDDGVYDFLGLRVADGDADKMPPVVADGQGGE